MKTYQIGFGIDYDRNGDDISTSDYSSAIERIRHHACIQFGGYTLQSATGAWYDDVRGVLIEENGRTLTIVTDKPQDAIEQFARYVADQLNRASVVLTLVGNAVFVNSTARVEQILSTEDEAPPIYDGHG